MAKRRKLSGAPLLLATAGMALTVGCGGSGSGGGGPVVTGNLMPPPMVKGTVCVDTVPEAATVRIDHKITQERCTAVETYSRVEVHVSAPGYADNEQLVDVVEDGQKVEVQVTLTQALEPPIDRPVGNLMPPPQVEVKPMPPEKP